MSALASPYVYLGWTYETPTTADYLMADYIAARTQYQRIWVESVDVCERCAVWAKCDTHQHELNAAARRAWLPLRRISRQYHNPLPETLANWTNRVRGDHSESAF